MRGLLSSGDGTRIVRAERRGLAKEAEALGEALARDVLGDGGAEILDALRAESPA